MKKFLGWACIVAALIIITATLWVFWPKLMDYKKGQDLYNDIRNEYTSPVNSPETEEKNKRNSQTDKSGSRNDASDRGDSEAGSSENMSENMSEDESSREAETESLSETDKSSKTKSKKRIKGTVMTYEDFASILKSVGIDVDKEGIDDYLPLNVDYEGLLDANDDYIGWIYIPKTTVSYPVVASKDNSDYLHTNFAKEYNFPGTIFMDCRDKKGVLNHHTILYGHNMRDGSMFAQIKSYRDQEWADAHPIFWFITPEGALLYRVFACCQPSPYDNEQFGVDGNEFTSNEAFGEAIKKMKETSLTQFDAEPDKYGYVMSLSTCVGDSSMRCIVHGMLLGRYNGNTKSSTG